MEVGCFTGDFLALAAAEGCDVIGFEFQDQAVALSTATAGTAVTVARAHWKRLTIEYVFEMMRHYGPEIRTMVEPLYRIIPRAIRNLAIPFFVGEMVLAARRGDG
jgi:hypothetical protein